MVLARLAQRAADADRERHGAGNRDTPGGGAVHAVVGDIGLAAHADGDAAGDPLGLGGRARLDDAGIALFVGDRDRRGRHAIDVEGFHLELREGAAHAVGIDQRQAALGGDHDGNGRIDAAGLERHHRLDLAAGVGLVGVEGEAHLVAAGDLLDQDGRRAHGAAGQHADRVRHLVKRQQPHRPVLLDRRAGEQLADIGVATATRAEHGGTERQVFQVVERDVGDHLRPLSRWG